MAETIDNKTALEAIANRQSRKERVVFTNGCFDILHIGHVRYLNQARALGDFLVVGLNSDISVLTLKGPSRPIVPEAERAEILLNLRSVDYVCLFSEETPLNLIKQVRPAVLVKGGDWPVEKIVGSDYVHSYGGEVRSLAFVPNHSSSEMIKKILSLG